MQALGAARKSADIITRSAGDAMAPAAATPLQQRKQPVTSPLVPPAQHRPQPAAQQRPLQFAMPTTQAPAGKAFVTEFGSSSLSMPVHCLHRLCT